MTANDSQSNEREPVKDLANAGKTIDLQGVASFAALVELLAHELGTAAVKIYGNIRTGAAFNQLVGEIEINNQGFQRKLTLFAHPGSPITIRFKTVWNEGSKIEQNPAHIRHENDEDSGIVADYFLNSTVEQILPQGMALARHAEEIIKVLDGMVSIGQSTRISKINIPASTIQAFESAEATNLVRVNMPKQSP
jgi:hypothetical protein